MSAPDSGTITATGVLDVDFTGIEQPRLAPRPHRTGLDGDGKYDLVVWRPLTGYWYGLGSETGYTFPTSVFAAQWGSALMGDMPLRGDVDGDGLMDLIVYRSSTGHWLILTSSSGYSYPGGLFAAKLGDPGMGDIPVSGDVDGDGRMDLIIYRQSTGMWFILKSSFAYAYLAGFEAHQWGKAGGSDIPLVGDADGDGMMDLMVWRPNIGWWYILTSSSGYNPGNYIARQWGSPGDEPVSGDIDGDGRMDLIVFRPSLGWWYVLTSSSDWSYPSGFFDKQWGNPGDLPVPSDLDADGRTDVLNYRPSTGWWYGLESSSAYSYPAGLFDIRWGSPAYGDRPVR